MAGKPGNGPCSNPKCDRWVWARGMCQKHYVAWRFNANAGNEKGCLTDKCQRVHYAKGLCSLHYERDRKIKNPGLPNIKTRQGAQSKKRRLQNPEYRNEYQEKQRVRAFASYWSRQRVDELLLIYGIQCHLCKEEIDLSAPRHALVGSGWEKGLHLDHLIPLSMGGEDSFENVRPAHAWCNISKGGRNRRRNG